MRTFTFSLLTLAASCTLSAGSISLTGSSSVLAFDGSDDVITLGSTSCSDSETCTYGGSQTLGSGTLMWQFQTPNTQSITYDVFGDVYGPTGGTFSVSDGVDSVNGTFSFTGWTYDGTADPNGDDGIDLNGLILVTSVTLEGGSDPNQAAFESFLSVPGASSYAFTLDVGDCTSGSKAKPCIVEADPSAQFLSLNLNAQGTPEPGTLALSGAGLVAAWVLRRRAGSR